MRTFHRITMMFAVLFTLYLGITGAIIQSIDLGAILKHAPATDPNVLSIREGISGPNNFQVIAPADYTAPALPASFDLGRGLAQTLKSARSALGPAVLDYIELRMAAGQPIGQVLANGKTLRFDATTGAALPSPPPAVPTDLPGGPRSRHDQVKSLHRMDAFGDWALWVNFATGLGLFTLVITGLILYVRLLFARASLNRAGLFWSGGGAWRMLHRSVALIAALFLLEISITGMLLATDNIAVAAAARARGGQQMGANSPILIRAVSPLIDADLPQMLRTTLAAYQSTSPDTPIRVIRLRIFGHMPQGAIITGDPEARQLIFNAVTGSTAHEYEKGYPVTGFPFGWDEHEIVKRIHRGDYFGLTGRWLDLAAGLSLVFLSASALVMYFDMWSSRKKQGRSGLFWS